MNQFLKLDSPFFKFMGKIGDIFLLNLMWVVFSIPIITIGASTTAAFSVGMRMARGNDGYVISRFWKSFKQNFKQATIIHIIMLIIGSLLYLDMSIWAKNSENPVAMLMMLVTVILSIIYCVEVLYVYAVLARFENTIKNTLKNAMLIAIANLPVTILLIIGVVIYLVLNSIMMLMTVLTVMFGMGLLAYIFGILYNIAFRRFAPVTDSVEEDYWHMDEEKIDNENDETGDHDVESEN